jgi:cytochrome P450
MRGAGALPRIASPLMTAVRSIAELPGPRGLPLLGNVHSVVPVSRAHLVLERWSRRYGPMFHLRVGRRPLLVLSDAEAINTILRDRPEGYRRASQQQRVIEEMNESVAALRENPRGVFIAEGEEWKRQRRLVVTALNKDHLHRYFGVVRTATERLYTRLRQGAAAGRPLAISEELTSFTVDVTSALAFGYDLNTLELGDGRLQEQIHTVLRMTARRLSTPVPYWRWVRLPADRALDRATASLFREAEGFIATARARMAERPELWEAPENLLEGMLVAQRQDGSFTDAEIASNAMTVLLAGEDTTAHTLGWTIALLGRRPDVQRRLREEAAAAFGEHPFATDHAAAERLPYAEAVLRESMRLKSVGPLLTVEPLEERTICGTRVPAGTQMLLLLREATREAAGRSEEFLPERWLADSEENRAPKSLNFGAGPRFCPGRNLAFLEAKAALAMLARNFELELDESRGPVRESFGFTMVPRGLRVQLRECGWATA